MMISSRGRYALRVMIDLAEHDDGSYIPMKEVAQRQDVSLKYLEKILPLLVSAKLIEGIQGKGGGYRMTRKPEEYRISEILLLTEGDLAPVACMEGGHSCERAKECRTLPLWTELNRRILEYLSSVTIADLMRQNATEVSCCL